MTYSNIFQMTHLLPIFFQSSLVTREENGDFTSMPGVVGSLLFDFEKAVLRLWLMQRTYFYAISKWQHTTYRNIGSIPFTVLPRFLIEVYTYTHTGKIIAHTKLC